MEVLSLCPFRAIGLVWQPRPSAFSQLLVCKGTFDLAPGVARLAEIQDYPNEEDNHWDDDARRSLYSATDLVPSKPRADVLLVGHAFAPYGQEVESFVTRFVVGDVAKAIEVVSERAWTAEPRVRFGNRITKASLRYERASGGDGGWNPVGVPTDAPPDAFGMAPLPALQPPGFMLVRRDQHVPPVGYGPLAPAWPVRKDKLGRHAATFDAARWHLAPIPSDLDPSYFNAAPADQQVHEIRPDERVELENLHPDIPHLVTTLPGLKPRAFVERAGKPPEEVLLRCDTLWIDTDRQIATLTWRGQIALAAHDEPGRVYVAMEAPGRTLSFIDINRLLGRPTGPSQTEPVESEIEWVEPDDSGVHDRPSGLGAVITPGPEADAAIAAGVSGIASPEAVAAFMTGKARSTIFHGTQARAMVLGLGPSPADLARSASAATAGTATSAAAPAGIVTIGPLPPSPETPPGSPATAAGSAAAAGAAIDGGTVEPSAASAPLGAASPPLGAAGGANATTSAVTAPAPPVAPPGATPATKAKGNPPAALIAPVKTTGSVVLYAGAAADDAKPAPLPLQPISTTPPAAQPATPLPTSAAPPASPPATSAAPPVSPATSAAQSPATSAAPHVSPHVSPATSAAQSPASPPAIEAPSAVPGPSLVAPSAAPRPALIPVPEPEETPLPGSAAPTALPLAIGASAAPPPTPAPSPGGAKASGNARRFPSSPPGDPDRELPTEERLLRATPREAIHILWFDADADAVAAKLGTADASARTALLSPSRVPSAPRSLTAVLEAAVEPDGHFEPPAVTLTGDLSLTLAPLDRLRALLTVAAVIEPADERTAALRHKGDRLLAGPAPEGAAWLAGRLADDLEAALAARAGAPDSLAGVRRALHAARAYTRSLVLGGRQVRGLLRDAGGATLAVYISEAACVHLPLDERFRARVVGELFPRVDATDPAPFAIRVAGIARVVTLLR